MTDRASASAGGVERVRRRSVRFRQADLTRALRAAAEAGLSVVRSEIDADGRIVLIYGDATVMATAVDELEEWRRRRAGRT